MLKLPHEKDEKKGSVYACRRGCKSLVFGIEAERYRRRSEALIASSKGIGIMVNRSIQAEDSFSLLKPVFGCRRFRHHGMENIETEWMILCMAGNALGYSHRLASGRAGIPFWFKMDKEAG